MKAKFSIMKWAFEDSGTDHVYTQNNESQSSKK